MRMLDMRLCDSSFYREPLQPAGMPEMRINDDKSLNQATRRFTMPGRDKTGPAGEGSMTGRGMGQCVDNTESASDVAAVGRGFGRRGCRGGRGQGRRRRCGFGANGLRVGSPDRSESEPNV